MSLDHATSGLRAAAGEEQLLDQLAAEGRAARVGGGSARWVSPARLDDARARIAGALERAHGRPAGRGALARAAGLEEEAAAVLLESMVGEGGVRPLGTGFVLAGEGAHEDPLAARVLAELERDGLEPRAPDALAAALGERPDQVREALERLVLEDGAVRVTAALYFHRDALEGARRRVVELCDRDGAVTIAGLRDELGTSRKYAQALLEHFDGERLTVRRGDEHVLRGTSR
jgi:selenocysteine-specific elongation factor